jgi:hypothetical protein
MQSIWPTGIVTVSRHVMPIKRALLIRTLLHALCSHLRMRTLDRAEAKCM